MKSAKGNSDWRSGYGVIQHQPDTVERVEVMLDQLVGRGQVRDREYGRALLHAADRIASQAMWLVVHMTYAQQVYLDGRALEISDFKLHPEGHTGGSLNMAIAYVGYLLANALTGETRSWVMEQGHCVAAIEAVNVLMRNTSTAFAARYMHNDEGLSRLCADFYAMTVKSDGSPQSLLGSHVNTHTGGGIMEGGYLGFAGLQYVHMPLPGQKLVAFLSDGAFEEQRGTDWAPRWWRAEDSGLVAPIMIANGRRIDQRTTMNQSGGTDWFEKHLRLNNFEPIVIDGRDPAAFAWAILTQERYLEHSAQRIAEGKAHYPVLLPYTVAETIKGFGFPGAGTNRAHGLPLPTNPREDSSARALFNSAARNLWVESEQLEAAVLALINHMDTGRVRERDHALAHVHVNLPLIPAFEWCGVDTVPRSAMAAIDAAFSALVQANPQLRIRVGNPDELRSNRLNATLDLLKHRVTAPEEGVAEAVNGSVITALNEEAVACAVFGNKQGLNLIASYEAFAVKMLGSVRQEIIFSRHCKENACPPGWLSVPLLASSHVWENGKNEQSHQDPTLAEALLGEMSDVSRVLFPVDWNSAIATLIDVYSTRGVIATIVAPKNECPSILGETQARALLQNGIALVSGVGEAPVQLLAIGAYQLQQALLAANRLQSLGQDASVWAVQEPGRFRIPRDNWEAEYCRNASSVLPPATHRVLFCHTRPEIMLGTLRAWDLGPAYTRALGYINRGGTLDTFGMLYANRCTWAHGIKALAEMREESLQTYFNTREIAALQGTGDPYVLRV
jgi:phosphoketolase